ncbi:hypothetical protein G2W53_042508 [Senna tora]|uniref:Uncharacterized protein n=1 Tax=Senna tora TaxID=362788 RepID=A0A834SH05_9FABA|nr:hypothetical protein G2W53_042508 [Senna tora]
MRQSIMQRPGIRVNTMEYDHHSHRRNKHRNRPEKPQQQIKSEIQGSKTQRPKIVSSYHRRLHAAHRNVTTRCAYQIRRVNEVPQRLNEARETKEEADQELWLYLYDQPGFDTCLHDSFNPSSLVVVLKALGCGVRPMEISVKEKEMIRKHYQQPTRDQHQVQPLGFGYKHGSLQGMRDPSSSSFTYKFSFACGAYSHFVIEHLNATCHIYLPN